MDRLESSWQLGPRIAEGPGGLYLAARSLDESNGEWTFPLFLHRALALASEHGPDWPQGMDLAYEPLTSWDETVWVLALNRILIQHGGIDPRLTYGVQLGIEMFESGYFAPSGRLPLPDGHDRFQGRHVVDAMAFEAGEIIFRNSWRPDWGDGGLGYLRPEYFGVHVDAVWASRPAWIGWSPDMNRELAEATWREGRAGRPLPRDVVQSWMSGNKRKAKEVTHRGRKYDVAMRKTFAARDDMAPLEMIDVRLGGRILGRMHILHGRQASRSAVEEMYVHPEYRELGLGSLLHDLAVERARAFGSVDLEIWLHEADAATAAGRDRARAFAESRGYELNEEARRRPNLAGAGRRRI
jgi:GNAT superfamily N-acetyltransferase